MDFMLIKYSMQFFSPNASNVTEIWRAHLYAHYNWLYVIRRLMWGLAQLKKPIATASANEVNGMRVPFEVEAKSRFISWECLRIRNMKLGKVFYGTLISGFLTSRMPYTSCVRRGTPASLCKFWGSVNRDKATLIETACSWLTSLRGSPFEVMHYRVVCFAWVTIIF